MNKNKIKNYPRKSENKNKQWLSSHPLSYLSEGQKMETKKKGKNQF
jgi:hypothetical protein